MSRQLATFRACKLLGGAAFGAMAVGYSAPAMAQSVCSAPILGAITCPGGDPTTIVDIDGDGSPLTVNLDDGFQTLTTLDVSNLLGGDILIDPATTAVINTIGEAGAVVNSGAALTARLTAISTEGDGATGALLRAVDGVVFTVDDLISTTGDLADGVNVEGSDVTVSLDTVRTGGEDSDGVELVSLSGPVNLDAGLIETVGGLSSATIVDSAGGSNINVGVLRTQGDEALGAEISADAAACVLLGLNGCNNTLTADQITTEGFGSIGALVSAVGDTDIDVGVLRTGGDEAAGLDLSADPTACVVVGVGACDTSFTVGELTTAGARSPGALVRAVGNIDGNIGVLRTEGDDAIGLDLASDPTACAILGAGACGTSFSIGELTTSGAGATGVLARVVGPTTANIDLLETLGDDAIGVDILADPTACAILGAGACDVGLNAGEVSTTGDGAAAVLLRAPSNILANLGLISTSGDNATGLGILTDPTACLALGPGACSVTAQVDDVETGGDNSPGVDVDSPGPIVVDVGNVDTDGDNSPGIDVDGGEGPIAVEADDVQTDGDDSPGVSVVGTGPIDVDVGTVETGGADSDGINVVGDDGPVTIDVGSVVTTGPDSDGIDVTTTTGDQTITAGPITVTGPGSDGIVATSGCAQIAITAQGAITSTSGTGILAESACGVAVTTLPGAAVSGGAAGIDVTSGTGASIVLGDAVSSGTGPAINADGAAATVTVQPTGRIVGYVDLTDSNDTLTNNGTFDATGTSSFGGGTDTLVNTGLIRVRPAATAPGTVTFAGLESTVNSGLIDLRNGQIGDVLTLSGNFTGTGNSQVGLDVAADAGTADRLVVAGAATGSTALLINPLGTGVLVNGALLVDAGAGTTAGAFFLPGGVATRGLVDYRIAFDTPANDFRLFGTPSNSAYQQVKLAEGVREIFYRGNDAVDGHMRSLRDAEGGSGDENPRTGSALWGQMYGQWSRYEGEVSAVNFGQASTARLDYVQDAFGGQLGYDFGGATAFGITAGYGDHTLRFEATADRFHYKAANVGAYARLNAGAFFINALARYEHYWIDVVSRSAGARGDMDGDSYGAMAQAGVRFGDAGFFVEPAVSIEYVRTDLGDLALPGGSFAFDNSEGLRGKAGARVGATLSDGPSRIQLYAAGNVVHDFSDNDQVAFSSGGLALDLVAPRIGTYGEGRVGLSAAVGTRVNGFIEANGRLGDGYRGAGGRAGLSIRF